MTDDERDELDHRVKMKELDRRMAARRAARESGALPNDPASEAADAAQEALGYGFIDKVITGAIQVPEGAGTRS